MARTRRATLETPPGNVEVTISLPQSTSIKVTDLAQLGEEELNTLLEQAKTSRVRFIILNAPFKVPPAASLLLERR